MRQWVHASVRLIDSGTRSIIAGAGDGSRDAGAVVFYRPLGDTFTGDAGGMVARMDTRDPLTCLVDACIAAACIEAQTSTLA